MMANNITDIDKNKARKYLIVACDNCKKLHAKCDDKEPCTRCKSKGIECVRSTFTKRGRKPKVKNKEALTEKQIKEKDDDQKNQKTQVSTIINFQEGNAIIGNVFGNELGLSYSTGHAIIGSSLGDNANISYSNANNEQLFQEQSTEIVKIRLEEPLLPQPTDEQKQIATLISQLVIKQKKFQNFFHK